MSDKDKLKDFLDKNLSKEFKKPVNEWSEIVAQIEASEESRFRWRWPSVAFGSLLTLALAFFVWTNPLSHEVPTSNSDSVSIVEFIIDSQDSQDTEEEADDYTYLALIE